MVARLESLSDSARRVVDRLGRRGISLLFLSMVDVAVALNLFTVDDYGPSVTRIYAGMALLMPLSAWAYVWMVVAGVLMVQAFMKADRIGFAVAALIKQVWAAGYLASWVFFDVDRAWIGAVTYLTFSGFVLMISGWQENSGGMQ